MLNNCISACWSPMCLYPAVTSLRDSHPLARESWVSKALNTDRRLFFPLPNFPFLYFGFRTLAFSTWVSKAHHAASGLSYWESCTILTIHTTGNHTSCACKGLSLHGSSLRCHTMVTFLCWDSSHNTIKSAYLCPCHNFYLPSPCIPGSKRNQEESGDGGKVASVEEWIGNPQEPCANTEIYQKEKPKKNVHRFWSLD